MSDSVHLPLTFSVGKVYADVKDATREVTDMSVSQEDSNLLDLTTHPGWKDYEEEVERRITALKSFVDPEGNALIDADGDPSLIGVKYLMVAFAIYHLRAVISIPKALLEYQRLHDVQKQSKRSGKGK